MDFLSWDPVPKQNPEEQKEKEKEKEKQLSFNLGLHPTPTDLIAVDTKHEETIKQLGGRLVEVINLDHHMVCAAFYLADFVPPDSDKRVLWTDILIPKLCGALVDDVKARNYLEKSLADILVLSVQINECCELMNETQGSKRSVEIAQDLIPKSLAIIAKDIEDLSKISNSAIELFENHAQDLLKIVGPKAADFLKQESDLRDQIDVLRKPIDALHDKLGEAKGKIEKYQSLVGAMEHGLQLSERELNAARVRRAELAQQVAECDNRINNIPQTQVHTHTSRFLWFRSYRRVEVAHPDRDAQKNYWMSVIQARNARLMEEAKQAGDVEKYRRKQEEDLAEYKARVVQSKEEYDKLSRELVDLCKVNIPRIDQLLENIKEVRDAADKTAFEVGMQGSALLECLTAIREFVKAKQEGTCLFEPLISVLKYIQGMTQASVHLLTGDRADQIVGGRRLMKNVGFIQNTSHQLRQLSFETQGEQKRKSTIEAAQQKKMITQG